MLVTAKPATSALSQVAPSITPVDFDWYAIRVRSRHEKTVFTGLSVRGYSPFLPLYSSSRRSSGATPSQLPYFPGYVFCRFDPTKFLPILTTSGVVSIINDGHAPVPVQDEEIDAVQRVVNSGLTPRSCAYINEGDRVRVEEGPLRGMEGIFVRIKSVFCVIVSISLFQRSMSVEVPREFVIPVRGRLSIAI